MRNMINIIYLEVHKNIKYKMKKRITVAIITIRTLRRMVANNRMNNSSNNSSINSSF